MKNCIVSLGFALCVIPWMIGCSTPKKNISKLDDAQHASIGAMTGSTGEQLAKQRFPDATVKSFEDIMDAVSALKADQIDAAITDYPAVMSVCKYNSDLTYIAEPVAYESINVAVRKGNDTLLARVNAIIGEMKNDGTMEDLKRRWLKTDTSPYEKGKTQYPAHGEILKIGTSATREPVCFVDANGNVDGHDIEMARIIGARLGRPVVFVDMKFSALIPSLQSGKIDMIVAGMTATPERGTSVDFSDSYFQNAELLIVKKVTEEKLATTETAKLKTLDDISDKIVGVYAGTVLDGFVAQKYPQAEIKRFNSTSDIILSLKTKKIDAAVLDLTPARVLLKSNTDIGILTDEVLTLPAGYGFNKNNPELRKKFNIFLAASKSDETYDAIYKRWFVDDPEKGHMPPIEFNKRGRKITLGVSVGDLPNCAIVDGEYVGFDIELLKNFARSEDFNMKIITMDFPSLIAALASGKVDIIADGICITEERQKEVDFSDPCNQIKTAVLALKENIAGAESAHEIERDTTPSPAVSFFQKVAESFHNNIIVERRYLLILDGLKTTLIISVLSIAFGTLLGGLICFMRMSRKKLLSLSGRLYISILRGTPVLVLLMIIYYVAFASVDIDPVIVAVIAFGLNFAAYVSEMYRTGIEGVEKGQTEAGIALGFTKLETFIYIVLPQAVRRILPVYKGEAISLVKMTSVVGYIAVQDLTKASDIIRSRTFDAFFPLIMVAVMYFFIAWLLMVALGYVEKLSDPKMKTGRESA